MKAKLQRTFILTIGTNDGTATIDDTMAEMTKLVLELEAKMSSGSKFFYTITEHKEDT